MVSEGINIPRLRVGIYATNILTELYFRQFVGRFVRMIPTLEGDQSAAVFIPSDNVLITHAKQVYDEIIHQVKVDLQDIYDEAEAMVCDDMATGDRRDLLKERSVFAYAYGEALPDGRVMLFGEVFTQQEILLAEQRLPSHLHTPEGLMGFVYALRFQQQPDLPLEPVEPVTFPSQVPVNTARAKARKEEERLKGFLFAQAMRAGQVSDPKAWYADLGKNLNKLVGQWNKKICSLEEYATRAAYLKQCIREEARVRH